jgi:hypothetical protein
VFDGRAVAELIENRAAFVLTVDKRAQIGVE